MTENRPNREKEKAAQMIREPKESMDYRQDSRDRKHRSKTQTEQLSKILV